MLLYIHIPFCASKCGYCAFNSFVDSDKIEAYIGALCEDIEHTLRENKAPLDTIFFGGGTPNFLSARHYERIFKSIYAHGRLKQGCEISLEANVNLVESSWCRALLSLGANRLSVGVQSFEKDKLAFLERDHSVGDIALAFERAHNAGFSNLSCDLILPTGLDSEKSIESEILQAAALPISHLSAYALSLDSGSRFYKERHSGGEKLLDSDTEERLSLYAREVLHSHGFRQYEVSNYVRGDCGDVADILNADCVCRHNLGYWQGREYLGCGAGAIGRVGGARSKALPNLNEYIKAPHKRLVEPLSLMDLAKESLMLGLRCAWGADLDFIAYALAGGDKGDREERKARLDSIIAPLLEGKEGAKCALIHRPYRSATSEAQSRLQSPQQISHKAPHLRQTSPHLVAKDMFLSDEISAWILSRL